VGVPDTGTSHSGTEARTVSDDRHLPTSARLLTTTILDAGWQLAVNWSDQGGSLHVTIDGMDPTDPARQVRVTWHSRTTGTLRLFSCLVGAGIKCHHSTLTKAQAYIRSEQ
jgi:hypothetical protein